MKFAIALVFASLLVAFALASESLGNFDVEKKKKEMIVLRSKE